MKELIRIVDNLLSKSELKVKVKGNQSYSSLLYRPKLDVTPYFLSRPAHDIPEFDWIIKMDDIIEAYRCQSRGFTIVGIPSRTKYRKLTSNLSYSPLSQTSSIIMVVNASNKNRYRIQGSGRSFSRSDKEGNEGNISKCD